MTKQDIREIAEQSHLSEKPVAQSNPPTNIDAVIQGEISGQVAVGSYILQIGSVHGGVVNITPSEKQPRPRLRPIPVLIRPRPFATLLGRETEISAAIAALKSALPVEFYSQAGTGKTIFLRYLAHDHQVTNLLKDGVVYLSARHQSIADLIQSLFDAFYETDVPFKPTDTQARQALQNKQALVLLDDVELAQAEVEGLMNIAPNCTFILASQERRLWGEGCAVALRQLSPEAALALVEQELKRPLTLEEYPAAQALCASLDNHPLHLLQAVAMIRDEEQSLVEVAQWAQSASFPQVITTQVLTLYSEPERQVLAVLAALGNIALLAQLVTALTALPDAKPILQTLLQRNLVQAEGSRYSLAGTLAKTLQQEWDLTPVKERALNYITTWVEQHRKVPNRLSEETDVIMQLLAWAVEVGHWTNVLFLVQAIEGELAKSRQWGAWYQVLKWGLQAARILGNQAAEAQFLHQLGTLALCQENSATARNALTQAIKLRESLGDHLGAEVSRHNLNNLNPLTSPLPQLQVSSQGEPSVNKPPLLDGLTNLGTGLLRKGIAPVLLLTLGGLGGWFFSSRSAFSIINCDNQGSPNRTTPNSPDAVGPSGSVGPTGAQGAIGEVGAQGVTGEAGAQGAIGEVGLQGATGEAGAQGEQGPPGPPGPPGEVGPPGPQGEQGPEGKQGPEGPPSDVAKGLDQRLSRLEQELQIGGAPSNEQLQ